MSAVNVRRLGRPPIPKNVFHPTRRVLNDCVCSVHLQLIDELQEDLVFDPQLLPLGLCIVQPAPRCTPYHAIEIFHRRLCR